MHKYSKAKIFFNQYGFCVINSFLKQVELKSLNKKIKSFIQKKKNTLKGKDINFTKNKNVNTMHDVNKFENYFKKFSLKKKNIDLADFFLDSTPEFRKCEIFAKPKKVGMPAPPHQDNYLWAIKNNNGITFWIALDKSNKANGGLYYIKSSHKLGLVKHENSYMLGTSQKIPDKFFKKRSYLKKFVPILKPGDMLIHHCLTIHGSGANKSSKSRLGFTIQYKDKNSKYDEKMLRNYEKNLSIQLKIRNKV